MKKRRKKKKGRDEFGLQIEPTPASGSMDDFALLVHGEKKIGKTSLAEQCDDGPVLFLQFDPPQKAYTRIEEVFTSWKPFIRHLGKLEQAAEAGQFPYGRVVVDGVERWYNLCFQFTCRNKGFAHPRDEAWGAGWAAIREEFTEAVLRMLSLPCGRWFLAHSHWKEIETREGDEVDKLVPKIAGQAEEVLNGLVDGWFAYDYDEKDRRVLVLQGSNRVGAGHRLDSKDNPHFRCKATGKALKSVRMGDSPEAAYRNLKAAFANTYDGSVKKKKKRSAK